MEPGFCLKCLGTWWSIRHFGTPASTWSMTRYMREVLCPFQQRHPSSSSKPSTGLHGQNLSFGLFCPKHSIPTEFPMPFSQIHIFLLFPLNRGFLSGNLSKKPIGTEVPSDRLCVIKMQPSFEDLHLCCLELFLAS